MYVLQSWTFTPGNEGEGTIEVPGVYTIEQFAHITNLTRNIPLFDPEAHEATAVLTSNGLASTLTIAQNTSFCQPTDELQIVMYNPYYGGGGGPTSDVAVTNWPVSQNINGIVEISNGVGDPIPVAGTVSVSNFPATQAVTGTFWQATQPVSGTVEVTNDVGNPLPISGTVTANQGTSPWVVSGSVTTTSTVSAFPYMSTDAFGRLRTSAPYTLFDSSHRYADNNLWSTATVTGGSTSFNAAQGLVDLNVTTASGAEVIRETTKVFAYQPGKSLLVMDTFVFNAPKTNLRQRVGYYGSANGYYLELGGTTNSLCFVERSSVTGSLVETKISQAGGVYGPSDTGWNVDPLNGTGPSGLTLDPTKAQILFLDMEWLGVGTVRLGFVIDGTFILCHQFQHANLIASTYITSASLPMRYEIANLGVTASASTLKQICTTVISEGGYELRGSQQSVGTSITAPKALTVAGTYYPVVSLQLKTSRLDAIAILTAISILGSGNNEVYSWRVVATGTVAGGTWVSAGDSSSVEYNLTGTGITGGRVLASGYTSASNQGSPSIDILKEALFAFQLERDGLTGTPYTLSVAVAGANASQLVYASMDWEEISR